MTAAHTVGAISIEAAEWYAIDWPSVYRNVRRLQVRIVKAMKENRWNKVKVLQRLLTCSYSGKVLAVRRVTENNGKETPGVDRVIWKTPEDKTKAVHDLKRREYHPQPFTTCLHPEKVGPKCEAALRNSHYDRSFAASVTFASARSRRGNHR
jgi:RNA-directed DNA polymerase